MKYLVEVPESLENDLHAMVKLLNPHAPTPWPVVQTDQGNIVNMDNVRSYYEDRLMEDDESFVAWADLPEATRIDLGEELCNESSWFDPDGLVDFHPSEELLQKFRIAPKESN